MVAKKSARKVAGKKSAAKAVKKKAVKKKAAKKKAATKKAAKKESAKKPAKKSAKKQTAGKAAKKTARAKASPAKPAEAESVSAEVASEESRVGDVATREPEAAAPLPPTNQEATGITSMDVSLGHVFTLRPRVNTSFPAEHFRAAKHQLRSEEFASIPEAARAVAERALEIAHQGPPSFKNQ